MKIGTSGDLHLDGPRAAIAERVVFDMLDAMEERACDLVLVPGDLVDGDTSPSGRLLLRRFVERATSFADLLLIDGNHDPEHELRILDAFGTRAGSFGFGERTVYVAHEPTALDLAVGGETLRVACLAEMRATYLKKMAVMLRGEGRVDVRTRDVVRHVLDVLRGAMEGATGPTLLAGHVTVGGARMDNDQPARASDPDLAIPLADLATIRAHAYVFGHVHLRQSWTLPGNVPAFYTGSPYATKHGRLDRKSWSTLTWTGSGFEVEVVPTTAPRLILLAGTWRREGDTAEMHLAYDKIHANTRTVGEDVASEDDVPPFALADVAGADVQLRYMEPVDDKAAAVRAAASHRSAILAAGAVACDVDPRAPLVVRSRAPELQQARTIPDKIEAYWRATSTAPDPDRRARIRAIVTRIEASVKKTAPISLARVDSLAWKGLGKLADAGKLTLDQRGVQVIDGPNEAGKSTLLSLLPAGLWGEGPKGGLDALATDASGHVRRGALLRLHVSTAQGDFVIEHEVDRKSATVWPANDLTKPLVSGRRAFQRWAAENLPSKNVLGWTSFLPAEGKSLLGLYDASLKDALLTLSGAPIFAALADLVSEEAKEARARARSLSDAVVRAGDPAARLSAVRAEMAAQQAEIDRMTHTLHEGHAVLTLFEASDKVAAVLSDVRGELVLAEEGLSEARRRIDAATGDDAVRSKRAEIEQQIAEATSTFERATQDAALHEAAMGDLEQQITQAKRRLATERGREERLSRRLARRAEYQAAADALPAAEEKLATANRAVDEAAAQKESTSLRGTMKEVRSLASSARLKPSIRTLDGALVKIRDKADVALAATSQEGKSALPLALAARAQAERERAEIADVAAKLDGLDSDAFEHEATLHAIEEEEIAIGLFEMRWNLLNEQHDDAQADRETAERDLERLTRERNALPSAPTSTLEQAKATAVYFTGDVARLSAREEEARKAFEAARDAAEQALRERLGQGAVRPTREQQEHLARARIHITRAFDRNEATAAHLEGLVTQLEADRAALVLAERDEGDLAELARVLSPKGMQAYEADVVGTEIADYATRLLQKHGFRWTLTYEPLREDVEQARWKLTDLDTGLSFDARSKGGAASDGQSFVTMTAIFFGARYCVATRGGGVADSTITIDEMTGAVREPRVQPWLALVRDGAEQTGARVVLFVPPNDSRLVSACDGRILVEPTGPGSSVVRT